MEHLTKSQKTAQFFSALGHPRRLRIISILAEHTDGLTFEQIEALSRINGSSLFHHLRPLRDAGLIHRKVKSRYTCYRLNRLPLQQYLASFPVAPKVLRP